MKIYEFEGKNLEDTIKKALLELKKSEDQVFIKNEEEEAGLFKSKKVKVQVLVKDEVLEYLKELLENIISKMGIKTKIEAKIRENCLKLSLYSDNNAVLIGKNGRTIESLQMILKAAISNQTRFGINVNVDVEDYKEKQLQRLEELAKRVAKEVIHTGIEVKLDSMNSYERRLVHEEASKVEGIDTISVGEEPNRCVVIKLKDK